MRTLAEAVEEFDGLANEAEAWLEAMVTGPAPDREMQSAVLHQLVEVAYSALWSCEEYQNRMRVAVRALTEGAVQSPTPPDEGPSTTPTP